MSLSISTYLSMSLFHLEPINGMTKSLDSSLGYRISRNFCKSCRGSKQMDKL